jgi:predicted restriction endonuclease
MSYCSHCNITIKEGEPIVCTTCYTNWRTAQNKQFKKIVYKKLPHKCANPECNVTDRHLLTIDHIDPYGDRYDIGNVRLLCANCHLLRNRGELE